MGMDLLGKSPDAKVGMSFHANVSLWRLIHHLVVELCADLLKKTTLDGMKFNDGFGPDDPRVCQLMADRFADWRKTEPNRHSVALNMQVSKKNELPFNPTPQGAFETMTYSTTEEQLAEWIEFLRHCGGFEVR